MHRRSLVQLCCAPLLLVGGILRKQNRVLNFCPIGDTAVTKFSFSAAKAAAGCVIEAVDLVMNGKVG